MVSVSTVICTCSTSVSTSSAPSSADHASRVLQYSLLPPGPHDPSFFDDPFDEALRPVELTLRLISRDEYFSKPDEIAIDPSRHSTHGSASSDDGSATEGSDTDSSSGSSSGSSWGSDQEAGPLADVGDPLFPTLYFAGESHGVATVRGKVSTLADGAVRWQFVCPLAQNAFGVRR